MPLPIQMSLPFSSSPLPHSWGRMSCFLLWAHRAQCSPPTPKTGLGVPRSRGLGTEYGELQCICYFSPSVWTTHSLLSPPLSFALLHPICPHHLLELKCFFGFVTFVNVPWPCFKVARNAFSLFSTRADCAHASILWCLPPFSPRERSQEGV